ncbi:YbjQ family protein [Defluviimonas salinarum]|uniref:UPF0145 protein OM960_15900 n=1 Tax=Defluviimonas salinarum TaxID=2992147 RepID=A0ABT3J5S2_9RHOB|nr:YbjQ family protein [Defluviimonas salinarum]MCW3783033.1 YbjQ family protein [Defluviimonas salinarum]
MLHKSEGVRPVLIITSEVPAGRQIAEVLGLVQGSAVRGRHIGWDIVASLRQILGGEMVEYSRLLQDTRRAAISRMVQEARILGADAIVAMRFQSSTIAAATAEMVAYGTAVRLR